MIISAEQEAAAYVLLSESWEQIARAKTLIRKTKLLLADIRAQEEARKELAEVTDAQ